MKDIDLVLRDSQYTQLELDTICIPTFIFEMNCHKQVKEGDIITLYFADGDICLSYNVESMTSEYVLLEANKN